jgi:transcriptional regulator with XRE-family HTH domain
MTVEQAKAFGMFLRHQREALGLNRSQLARLIDTRDSTINRLEAGAISAPRPDKLTRIADYLHLDLADVFAMVGYAVPRQLPACLPYLRAKYPTLPQAAIEEMESDFKEVAARHGVTIDHVELPDDRAKARSLRPTRESLKALGKDFA